MSLFKHGRYSGYLRPISYLIDLSIINAFAALYLFENIDPLIFVVFMSVSWILLSIYSNFYEVYRYTRVVFIFALAIRQGILFLLLIFAFFGYYNHYDVSASTIVKFALSSLLLIILFKFTIYYLLQKIPSRFWREL